MNRVLLLSGGLDSTAVAAMVRPEHCVHVDYGQIPAEAELRAAAQVAVDLGLPFTSLAVPAGQVGAGLMSAEAADGLPVDVSPEWWPFRNQLLITLAAAWAVQRGFEVVIIGTVASDGARHADGTRDFLTRIDDLLAVQEGHLRVEAPAAGMSSAELITTSGVTDAVLGWTHSCHRANFPCGACPGCVKRQEVLQQLDRLR
ncbi:putative hydrolase [Microlunatus phosphovorus NM-1]|uniref:7-cyano-7-deazaguanine synthase n=1 Tax=Microlunatus phosphovorus (strain ATCC 700054 / DSM 10555 / JCM 9379 / NBRC 101784 / NCIMB 13414 / VKM Ac-1990 / NM-1) TaxID=1032480 RepID=F5XIP1_MICPN|nr:7-cyano-7-deazaguanine synthase [Microlunatus phosphovorus]BAK38279.1 putative hydrolase [Microlunatus phosphovorus NM-1]